MSRLLTHDVLTGLPNRAVLEERLHEALSRARRHQSRLAVLVIGLDRLKSINDSLGRRAGDQVLAEVGRRLRGCVRRTDVLARLCGNEFVLVLDEIPDPQDVQPVAAKIMAAVAEPVCMGSTEVFADLSVGISLFPEDGSDVHSLLLRGDAAMRHAKKLGGKQVQFFASSISVCTREQLELANALRRSVALGQLVLHYQPKVEIATGRVNGAEALLRWRHPVRGLLRPDAFMSVAEETALIVSMGEWVLREACRQASEWQRSERLPIAMAVNLSSQQLRRPDLVELVRSTLRDAGLQPRYLELELTEGALIHDPQAAAETLLSLCRLGVRIAIDDFGVGYSCMNYLTRFPIGEIKIDRGFVSGMLTDAPNASIVRAIVSLAHGLGLNVVAEGVETAEQLRFLAHLKCDQYQGYLCSPPVPSESFLALLRRNQQRCAGSAHLANPDDSIETLRAGTFE